MTEAQVEIAFRNEMKGLHSLLTANEITRLAEKTTNELGWSFPLSTSFQKHWYIERMKRHAYWFFLTEAAHKFKYKQVNLQHRFDHYIALIKMVDEQFAIAIKENPAEMAGVNAVQMFGHQASSGFSYSELGLDTTYKKSNKVSIAPTENDS